MTSRERFLLGVLGWTLGAVLLFLGSALYLDRVQILDRQFVGLQKRVTQLQLTARGGGRAAPLALSEHRNALLWAPGTLPDPLGLAKATKALFGQWDVRVTDFHVVDASAQSFRLRYGLEAPMAGFLGAFVAAQSGDPHLINNSFSASLGEHGTYQIIWEFGYASLP